MNMRHRLLIFLAAFSATVALCMILFDRTIALAMLEIAARSPAFIEPFALITKFGLSQWYLWPLAAFIAAAMLLPLHPLLRRHRARWRRHAESALFVFTNVAGIGLAANIVKIIVGRSRPVLLARADTYNRFNFFVIDARSWSFPSGHTVTAVALAFALATLFPRWRYVFYLFAGVIGASRIIVAAHYPSDVIASIMLVAIAHGLLLELFVRRGWNGWDQPAMGSIPKP